MKKKIIKFFEEYKPIIIFTIAFCIFIAGFIGATYKCKHNENYLYYGNDNYRFVTVWVGSGRSEDFYCGAITVDDYKKWCDGKDGTIFVYSVNKEGYGYRFNISKITSINNHGSEPDWLPLNFGR